jgi:branched-chain amino acid transport system ATP-binding protein
VLRVEDIRVSYGQVTALWGVSFEVGKGEIVALVGGNGAGKTTTLKTVSGLLRPAAGRIVLDEDELQERSTMEIVDRGVVQVPEGRKLFPELTVRDNLLLGAFRPASRPLQADRLARVYQIVPRLLERE